VIYRDGLFVELDEEDALDYFHRALDAGHSEAVMALGRLYNERMEFDQAYNYYDIAYDKWWDPEGAVLRDKLARQGWVVPPTEE
jgi:TPR repeat protein